MRVDMVTPRYVEGFASDISLETMLTEVSWGTFTDARQECFMGPVGMTYTYGSGRGVRTYTAIDYHPVVLAIQNQLNTWLGMIQRGSQILTNCQFNVCFLNRYDDEHQQLGWHADDSPGMDHEHPIAVVSFGQEREIWWREVGHKGVIPPSQRQTLGHGSLFIMPVGFQRTHQHRIPKGDRSMGARVSLTYRHYVADS